MRRWVLLGFWLLCVEGSMAIAQGAGVPQEKPDVAAPTTNRTVEPTPVPVNDAARPLPKLEDLIAKTKAHQSAAEELQKNYTCKQTVVADEFDSHGNKKGTHTDEYQTWTVSHANGDQHLYVTVSQHLAHDGKPLPPDQAQKEQERIDKEIASIKDGSYKARGGGGLHISVTNLLKMATFSNERRVEVDGRPTIEFDYKGDPDAKASDMGQEVMKKLTGELWLDEEDAAVVRLQGKLNENFHVAGGLLVNVKAGSWFELTTVHINGEIWFVQHLQAHADGRFLLFKGFDGDANFSFSDYRKMRTSVTLLPGSQVIGEDGKPIPNLAVEPDAPSTPPTTTPH